MSSADVDAFGVWFKRYIPVAGLSAADASSAFLAGWRASAAAMREECEEWMDDLQAQADMYSSAQKANDVHSWAVDLITMIAATKAAIRGTEQDGGGE